MDVRKIRVVAWNSIGLRWISHFIFIRDGWCGTTPRSRILSRRSRGSMCAIISKRGGTDQLYVMLWIRLISLRPTTTRNCDLLHKLCFRYVWTTIITKLNRKLKIKTKSAPLKKRTFYTTTKLKLLWNKDQLPKFSAFCGLLIS